MNLDSIVQRADQMLALGEATKATSNPDAWGSAVDAGMFTQFRAASLSFLASVFGTSHPYYVDYDSKVEDSAKSSIEYGLGILTAVRDELAGGWLTTTRGLITSEVFGDFLEMADHLAAEHYQDAAAVIAGSTLEEHMRQLAAKSGIATSFERNGDSVPKKADALNSELAAASAYSKLEQKSITAWLGLRNNAAHGKYDEYDLTQVKLMIEGIRQFMIRVPA